MSASATVLTLCVALHLLASGALLPQLRAVPTPAPAAVVAGLPSADNGGLKAGAGVASASVAARAIERCPRANRARLAPVAAAAAVQAPSGRAGHPRGACFPLVLVLLTSQLATRAP